MRLKEWITLLIIGFLDSTSDSSERSSERLVTAPELQTGLEESEHDKIEVLDSYTKIWETFPGAISK